MYFNRLFILSIFCIFIQNIQLSSQEDHEHHHVECEENDDCTSVWGENALCDVANDHCTCIDGSELISGKCVTNTLDMHEEQQSNVDTAPVKPHVHVEPRIHNTDDDMVPSNETKEEGGEQMDPRALVDQVCNVNKDCSIQGAICNLKKCECPSNFVLSANLKKCLPLATDMGWGCEENVQCTTLLNKTTECRDSTCSCKFGTVYKDGKCVESKGLDAFCESSMVCTTPHAECSQGICACVEGYVPSPDNSKCLQFAKGFRAPCEESIQCSNPFGPDATCLNMQCVCRGGHHFAEMRCWKDKGLTDTCSTNAECHIVEDGASQKLECAGGECTCQEGFESDLENSRCSGVSITMASISTLLALILHLL